MRPGTLVLVEWLDAGLDTGDAGVELPDVDPASQNLHTIGYFLKAGTVNLIVAQEYAPDAPDHQFRCITRIPWQLVRRVWRINSRKRVPITKLRRIS